MVLDGGMGAPEWLTKVTGAFKDTAAAAGQAAVGAAANYAGQQLISAGAAGSPQPMPPKPAGIPKGVLIAGSVVIGIGLLALLTRRRSEPARQLVTNPRRRRRRARRRRR